MGGWRAKVCTTRSLHSRGEGVGGMPEFSCPAQIAEPEKNYISIKTDADAMRLCDHGGPGTRMSGSPATARAASGGKGMLELLTEAVWSPYIAGAGVGVMSVLSFLLANRPLGCSTAFAKTSGMVEMAVRGEKVKEHPYYRKFVPNIDGSWMIVVGVVIGAFISSILSGVFALSWVPAMWGNAFGYDAAVRLIAAFAGGVLLGFGARWAGGCTSGHGISGTLQLSVNSMIAAACCFVGGIVVAMIIYGVPAL